MRQFCEKKAHPRRYHQEAAKSRYSIPSDLVTFHSLVKLLLPAVKLNGVRQPMSIEYKRVHGFNQTVFRT